MAIEGPPATQTLTYGGHAYAFQAEGRGEERVAKMVVAGKPYAVKATETGDFEIKDLPAGAGLPSVLPKGQYKLDVKDRDPTYLNIFWLALSLVSLWTAARHGWRPDCPTAGCCRYELANRIWQKKIAVLI